jgi:hypothetical protein
MGSGRWLDLGRLGLKAQAVKCTECACIFAIVKKPSGCSLLAICPLGLPVLEMAEFSVTLPFLEYPRNIHGAS